MVLRVKPTPTRLPTNSLYTPMDNTPLHSISSVRHPWGNHCCPLGYGQPVQAYTQPCTLIAQTLSVCLLQLINWNTIMPTFGA